MNKVPGKISNVQKSGRFVLVTVSVTEEINLKAIAVDAPDTDELIEEGNVINLLFKESEVVIGSNKDHEISLQNRIPGIIKWIDSGLLISKLAIDTPVGTIVSIISTNSVERLQLKEGKEIFAMIKLNEMMLSE